MFVHVRNNDKKQTIDKEWQCYRLVTMCTTVCNYTVITIQNVNFILHSTVACIKIDVKTHEMICNCGLTYSTERDKLHKLILWQEFVHNVCS